MGKNQDTEALKVLAAALSEAFEHKERDQPNEFGDKDFVSLRKGSPEWMTDAVRTAHDGIMPNDWIYAACNSMADHMAEREPEEWDDAVSEWADGEVDVYNAARTRWLAAHLDFGAAVDEAVEELGHSDQGVFGDIGLGQYRVLERIAYALIAAVRDQGKVVGD